jgi:transformation/transcription domain-associated protein
MVFDAFPIPLDSINSSQEIRPLHSKVEELIQKHLAAVAAPQISLETNSANLMIRFAFHVIKTLADGQESFIDPFMMPLIRVLQRLTGEMGTLTNSVAKQVWHILPLFTVVEDSFFCPFLSRA